jgi:predicted N-acetyltransferase YhbS
MFTKATITNEYGLVKKVVSFGPLSVLPDYQRKGYGTALLNYAFAKTLELGYDVVIIYGDPENYICHGFRSCRHYHIHVYGAVCPTALLVKELKKNAIAKADYWSFHDSPV